MNTLRKIFEQYYGGSHIECEFRLGFLTNNGFDTNITKPFFETIQEALNNRYIAEQECGYMYYHNEYRLFLERLTKTRQTTYKKRLHDVDIDSTDSPFAIRFSASIDKPVDGLVMTGQVNAPYRYKEAYHYTVPHPSIHGVFYKVTLCRVVDTQHGVNNDEYIVEVECLESQCESIDVFNGAIHWIQWLINTVEPIGAVEWRFIKQTEKDFVSSFVKDITKQRKSTLR